MEKKIIVRCCIGFVVIVAAIGIGFWYNAYQAEQNQISLLPADSEIYTMELGSATPSDASVFIDKENTSKKMQNADKEIQLVYTDDQIITKEDGTSYLKVGDYEGTISVGSKIHLSPCTSLIQHRPKQRYLRKASASIMTLIYLVMTGLNISV